MQELNIKQTNTCTKTPIIKGHVELFNHVLSLAAFTYLPVGGLFVPPPAGSRISPIVGRDPGTVLRGR